ncbi:MAG: response regulator [Methanospirillum sp.]
MTSILYVDDEPELAALLRHYLQQSGEFRVYTAGSGPEALAFLERHAVDVVVSDYQMPGMNGVELLRECRQRFDGLPFLLFTGRGREEVVIEAIENGVDFYLQKGGDPESQFAELALKCRQAVRRQRPEEVLRASEARNRRIIEGSPTGIHLYELVEGGTLVFLGANPAADRILEIRHADVVGRTIDDAFPGLRETEVPQRYLETARTGEPWHADLVTYRDRRIVGAYEVWSYSIGPGRIVAQFVDIADRLALEEELRELGRQWEVVFETIGQPAMILSPDQTILAVNRAAERATGLPADEMVGRRCAGIFHGSSGSPEGCPFDRLLEADGAEGTVETVVDAVGGTFLVSCTPIYDDEGRLEKVVHLATEITDRVRHEQALRLANDKLALISNVTRHDLRNRLMGLQGYLRMAERATDPEKRARYRRLITETTRAMEEILSFAADYERVGMQAPEWQRLDEVLQAALGEVELDGIRLEVETGDVEVLADPLLRKVFSNLMDNSLRYGETVTRIRVSARRDGDALVVVYEDDGAGIPRDEKELIFFKGYGKNTGLGLYLTTQVLSITGIEIRETGTLGIGARFELRWPPGTWR